MAKPYLCAKPSKMFENKGRTPISSLGEFGLIEHLTKNINLKNPSSIKGVGDDAAVLAPKSKQIVVTTDLLVEGVHFDVVYSPMIHLGYKAIVVNLSDVCAMNATPTQVTVSLAIPAKFTVEAMDELYEGIYAACEQYKVDLVGGDTTTSMAHLCISVTAIGEVDKDKVVYRNTANENDLICVTGELGGAYIGLQILEREKQIFLENPGVQPDLGGKDYVLERQLKPEARLDMIKHFEKVGLVPSSMIDISDGLSSELFHLCAQSEKGCRIYEEKIPIDQMTFDTALEFSIDPTLCALSGGEDYELLFTIKLEDYDKIKNDPNISVIGHITDKASGLNMTTKNGVNVPLKAQGWNSFNQSEQPNDN